MVALPCAPDGPSFLRSFHAAGSKPLAYTAELRYAVLVNTRTTVPAGQFWSRIIPVGRVTGGVRSVSKRCFRFRHGFGPCTVGPARLEGRSDSCSDGGS